MAEARQQPDPIGRAPGAPVPDEDLPTRPVEAADGSQGTIIRLFGSDDFFRLWLAQVVSALGDWLGFVAIVAVAARVGGSSPEAAISLVMSARLVPGFFFAPVAGLVVDRLDRKKVMVACDIVRGLVLLTVPFITSVWALVVASLLLELGTLLWSPAKEATVPNLVPPERLTTANSLSLVAAYGTFPVASLIFAVLAKLAQTLGEFDALHALRINQESLAIYADVVTFFVSAFMISTLVLATRAPRVEEKVKIDFGQAFRELREGWRFMAGNPVVRAVMIALGTGLFGGGMLVPLGDTFSRQVLGGGTAGFGLLEAALGFGVASGVIGLSVLQKRLPHEQIFCWSVVVAGLALILACCMSSLTPALAGVAALGVCAGAVYVLGFTILHETVADELRGRIFSSLYTLVRFCLLLSFAVGPLLSNRLDALSDHLFRRRLTAGGLHFFLPGVRLTLMLSALIILGAGGLAFLSLRSGRRERAVADPV